MEAFLVSFRRELHGLPYHIHCEDDQVSDGDAAWLREHIFDPDDPVVDLSPGEDETLELFHSLYLDGNYLTEITATLEAPHDAALLEQHQRLRRDLAAVSATAAPFREECRSALCRTRQAGSVPLIQGQA